MLIDMLRDPALARERLERAGCTVMVEPALLGSRLAQQAMLTIAATLSPSHRAGVHFILNQDHELAVRAPSPSTLQTEIRRTGGQIGPSDIATPIIAIGKVAIPPVARGVRLHVAGPLAGCTPLHEDPHFDQEGFGPAAIMAASLGCFEFYRFNALGETDACADVKAVDLAPGFTLDQLTDIEDALPQLWFVGAGHLGQAAMFAATLVGPKLDARRYKVQDYDRAVAANPSTQILCRRADEGARKVDLCSRWLRARGIDTVLVDVAFGTTTRRSDGDPEVIIAGLDAAEPRRSLESAGARLVVDAGLGGLAATFASFRIHTFPGPESAEGVFSRGAGISEARHREDLADFYETQVTDPEHVCGARDVAGVSVGAPFVGTAVAALTLTQAMLHAAGFAPSAKTCGDLRLARPITFRTEQRNVP